MNGVVEGLGNVIGLLKRTALPGNGFRGYSGRKQDIFTSGTIRIAVVWGPFPQPYFYSASCSVLPFLFDSGNT